MPPGFDTLSEQDLHDEEEEIDFSGKPLVITACSYRPALMTIFFSILQISERNMKSG